MAEIFTPADTNAIAATATSQVRTLAAGGSNAAFYNDGPSIAFVVTGPAGALVATLPALSAAVGAAGNATPIPVGASINLDYRASHTQWAVICPAAGTANVYCTPGVGF